jgi:acetylornithine deacetylase/succinyl-diaminopimelate desuccinylase-like protein
MKNHQLLAGVLTVSLFLPSGLAAYDYDAMAKETREHLAAMIAADTTNPPGAEAKIAELVEGWLKADHIECERTSFDKGRENVVARLKGSGHAPPVMLLGHIDVVGTGGQVWQSNPHQLTEKEGYLYGRGTSDMLGQAAVELETFLTLKRSKVKLRRDVILAFTGDEESSGKGIQFLLAHRPESIKAGFVLNEGGKPLLGADGKARLIALQVAEKSYQDYELKITGPTGHSSVPVPGNAIIRLSTALSRLGGFRFPARLLPATRAYFAARAKVESGSLAAAMQKLASAQGPLPEDAVAVIDSNPLLAPNLRTTCVATTITGGSALNALPAEARATVNCRILPDETIQQVRDTISSALGDPGITVTPIGASDHAGASPLDSDDLNTTRQVLAEQFPATPVVPLMGLGASDSLYLRRIGIPAYGLSPLPISEEDSRRAHGIDERIPVASLRKGVEFYLQLVLALAAAR